MAKVRTTIGLSEETHIWLKQRASTYGQINAYLEAMIQKERTLGPLEQRLRKQADRLEDILNHRERPVSPGPGTKGPVGWHSGPA